MITLSCRETGMNCSFVAEGETEPEILKSMTEHAIKAHGMRAEDIYLDGISAAFSCHSISKIIADKNNKDRPKKVYRIK
jgi:predicted small metal-binding protein